MVNTFSEEKVFTPLHTSHFPLKFGEGSDRKVFIDSSMESAKGSLIILKTSDEIISCRQLTHVATDLTSAETLLLRPKVSLISCKIYPKTSAGLWLCLYMKADPVRSEIYQARDFRKKVGSRVTDEFSINDSMENRDLENCVGRTRA